MRICSLLPSATEILFALGLEDSVMGVTHECDFPPAASKKPALIQPRLDPAAPAAVINQRVSEMIQRGESIYAVRDDLLREIEPDLIITQDLCHVCAASPDDLAIALSKLKKQPRILMLAPHSLADVWDDIRRVGEATGTEAAANALAKRLSAEVEAIRAAANSSRPRPRVACIEWLDPLFNAGHWVPEMVECAGGIDVLAQAGKPSVQVASADVIAARPDVIVVMPCGYDAARAAIEFRSTSFSSDWRDVSAVQNNSVYAVDANSYFSRSGPRLAEGVAILAKILHPQAAISEASATTCEHITTEA
ncbi:MAG: cobalamin-binding protein [Candidatus Acidiferrales bacterium]|jgi:iron complex transport system substrate-binding protein